MKKVIVYLNQFFGRIGGEEAADHEPVIVEGAAGSATALEMKLEGAEVINTVICGDNYMASNTKKALSQIKAFLENKEFDLLIAGPAFLAGRYGFSCGEVCKAVGEEFGVPTVTSMNENNPGVELYKKYTYIVPGSSTAAGMAKDSDAVALLANKILAGKKLNGAEAEGYFPRGIRKEVRIAECSADRAVDMLLKKLAGEKYKTEFVIEKEEKIPPLNAVDTSKLKVAFVTTGGLVPTGNPDHLPAGGATRWFKYSIKNKEELNKGDYISVHGGYNTDFAADNPMVLVPLDALRQHVREGHIRELAENYYVTVGNQTAKGDALRMAKEIVEDVRKDGVEAIVFGST